MPRGRRRIMRKFRIDEISGVDMPAQEGARALLLKRDAASDRLDKSGLVNLVTGTANGHAHGITVRRYRDGELNIWVEHAQADSGDTGHSHALMMSAEGVYTVVENAGHSHTLDSAALAAAIVATVNKEADMTDEERARLAKLEKELARSNAIVALGPEHRAHFDELSTDEHKDKFLAKSDSERDALIAEAKKRAEEKEARKNAADPVVYTTEAGIEIRKSDGATMLALAKQQDATAKDLAAERKDNAALRNQAATADFEKRAETELAHLPGTVQHRAALLKAAEGIEDEQAREAATNALKAGDAALAPAFGVMGVAGGQDVGKAAGAADPEAEMDALVAEYRKAHPEASFAQAYAAVMQTEKGREILAKSEAEYRGRPHIEAAA